MSLDKQDIDKISKAISTSVTDGLKDVLKEFSDITNNLGRVITQQKTNIPMTMLIAYPIRISTLFVYKLWNVITNIEKYIMLLPKKHYYIPYGAIHSPKCKTSLIVLNTATSQLKRSCLVYVELKSLLLYTFGSCLAPVM